MKPEKRYFAIFKLARNWVIRLIAVGLIIGGLFHFPENPSGISILIVLCISVASILFDEKICIYNDRWEFNKLYAAGLYVKRKQYEYKSIKDITLDGERLGDGTSLEETISDRYFQDMKNNIEIIYQDDQTEFIKTNFYKTDLRDAIKRINKHIEESNKSH